MVFLPTEVRAIISTDSDVVVCDASLSEDHVFKNTVTKIPIEDGSIITDHITVEPARVEMILLFTDTPVSNFDPLEQFKSDEGRGRGLFQKVFKFRNDKAILKLTTGLQGYTNMAIEELSVPRRSGDGKRIQARCVFSEIPIVSRSGTGLQGITAATTFDVSHTAGGLIELGPIT